MKYLIITGSPKRDGLCHSITSEIARGASDGGAEIEILNANGTEVCKCCDGGWGSCGNSGRAAAVCCRALSRWNAFVGILKRLYSII